MVLVDLKKLCFNKIFWSAITASFAFSILLFNIAMETIDGNTQYTNTAIASNAEEIQIVHEDIKQILIDTSYIRGFIDDREK